MRVGLCRRDDITKPRQTLAAGPEVQRPSQALTVLVALDDHQPLFAMRKTSYAIAFLLVAALLAVVSVIQYEWRGLSAN